MPVSRRVLITSLPLAALIWPGLAAAQTADTAVFAVRRFYDQLLGIMQQAKQLTFDQRFQLLAGPVSSTLNLPLMSRIAVGARWAQMTPDQQQRVTDAFGRYMISMYASRFDGYSGERFEVEPQPKNSANGLLVQTRIIKSNGEPVTVNYLMRQGGPGGWQVIDIFLNGTISELATRRSEFASVLQRGGAEGLVQTLEARVASLRSG